MVVWNSKFLIIPSPSIRPASGSPGGWGETGLARAFMVLPVSSLWRFLIFAAICPLIWSVVKDQTRGERWTLPIPEGKSRHTTWTHQKTRLALKEASSSPGTETVAGEMLQLKFYRRVKEYCRKITWTAGEQDLNQLALRHDRHGFSAFRKVWGLWATPVGERSARGLALIIIFAWAPAKLSPTRLWGSKLQLNQQILNRNVLVYSYKYGVHHFF